MAGNVVVGVVLPLALGSGVGSYLGARHLALALPEEYLKWGFCTMMLFLGALTIRSAGPIRQAVKKL
jgi:uncharacterized membrane protein YfcA